MGDGRPVDQTGRPSIRPLLCEGKRPSRSSPCERLDLRMTQSIENFGSVEVSVDHDPLPHFVTFASGPALLMKRGLVESITSDGLRYIARHDPKWPFGDKEGQHPYLMVGRTRTMETGTFLAFFEQGPPRGGRGLNVRPKKS